MIAGSIFQNDIEEIAALLRKHKMTVTTAESCTGGLLSGRLLSIPGASDIYCEGHITYSNETKEKILGVSHETLKQYGAVSAQTAKEMALGAAQTAKAEAALSVTGIAGPGGGTKEKPVGLVYIGCYINGTVEVREFHFSGTREDNRESAVNGALAMLKEQLLHENAFENCGDSTKGVDD